MAKTKVKSMASNYTLQQMFHSYQMLPFSKLLSPEFAWSSKASGPLEQRIKMASKNKEVTSDGSSSCSDYRVKLHLMTEACNVVSGVQAN